MISDELKNEIEAKSDIQNQKIIAAIKEGNNTRIGRESPAPRNMYDLNKI